MKKRKGKSYEYNFLMMKNNNSFNCTGILFFFPIVTIIPLIDSISIRNLTLELFLIVSYRL